MVMMEEGHHPAHIRRTVSSAQQHAELSECTGRGTRGEGRGTRGEGRGARGEGRGARQGEGLGWCCFCVPP
eukprot:COSAG01_NODE_526_length_15908_cov_6.178063_7_plen_71_part_00